jgi:adenylate kinase
MSGSNRQNARRIVIVGIPGVGKSSVVSKVVELLKAKGKDPNVVNYGTVMFEEARSLGVKGRDEIRKLSIEKQRTLQVHAASRISEMHGEFVIVDTHLFISTPEGYWPGIPMDVLQALKPTNLILITAKPNEIAERRQKDQTRFRDSATTESLEKERSAASALLYSSSVIAGCPALIVENPDGKIDDAAMRIISAITSS